MSAPFAPGDVVVFLGPVGDGRQRVRGPSGSPRRGCQYQVGQCLWVASANPEWGVVIVGLPSPHVTRAWRAISFRKLRPNEREAHEAWRKMLDAPAQPEKPVLNPARHSRERV